MPFPVVLRPRRFMLGSIIKDVRKSSGILEPLPPMFALGTDLQIHRFMQPALLVCFYSLSVKTSFINGSSGRFLQRAAVVRVRFAPHALVMHTDTVGRQIVARVPLPLQ